MTPRMWIGVVLVAFAATPAAVMWWLLHSISKAIERVNPS